MDRPDELVARTSESVPVGKTSYRTRLSPAVASVLVTVQFNETELRKLDLNLLLVFSALMRERSATRAGTRLYVGRTAVSMALGRLRSALDDPLFVRAGTALEPTARASALWAELEPALGAIEAAVRRSRGFDPATSGTTFRFAAPDDLEFVLVPRLLDRLAREAPHARLVVRPSDFRTLLGRLDDADAELALSATPTSGLERRHHVRPLHTETFSVLHDPDTLPLPTPIDLDTWLSTPQVMVSIDGSLDSGIDRHLDERDLDRRVVAAVAHFPTLPFVLRRRAVLANVPSTAAGLFAAEYDLVSSPLPLNGPAFDLALVHHARTDTDPAQVWFRRLVEEEVAGLSLPEPVPRPA